MSDFVQFETNVPQELRLAYDDGKLVETRFGDKVFYTLMDGRTLSVLPSLSAVITEKEIKKGEPFLMCKREVRANGKGKASIQWVIDRAGTDPLSIDLTQTAQQPRATAAAVPQQLV